MVTTPRAPRVPGSIIHETPVFQRFGETVYRGYRLYQACINCLSPGRRVESDHRGIALRGAELDALVHRLRFRGVEDVAEERLVGRELAEDAARDVGALLRRATREDRE